MDKKNVVISAGIKRTRLETFVKYLLAVVVILTFLVFSVISKKFLSFANIRDMLRSAGVLSLTSMGMMICLTTGDMNFAIGAQLGITAAVVGRIMDACTSAAVYPIAVAAAIAASVIVSLICAFLVVTLKVPAFIGTLGVQLILNGIINYLTNNTVYFSYNWGPSYTYLGQTNIFGVIPIPVLVAAVACLLIWVLMTKTTLGRNIFSLGANVTASRQMGINVEKDKYIAYIICGILVGVAGVIQTSITKGVSISMGGELLLPTIASCMLGATFLTPGKYNVWGCVVAAIFNYVIQYGVVTMGMQFNMREVIQGAILIVAISMVALVRKEGLPQVKFE